MAKAKKATKLSPERVALLGVEAECKKAKIPCSYLSDKLTSDHTLVVDGRKPYAEHMRAEVYYHDETGEPLLTVTIRLFDRIEEWDFRLADEQSFKKVVELVTVNDSTSDSDAGD
jgi:hypothetical protein